MAEGPLPVTGRFQQNASESYTVLLVENDANLRSLIEMLLRREGYQVVVAANVAAAADITATRHRRQAAPIDLLILDLPLPRTDASTLMCELKETSANGRLPVLVVSSFSETECRARFPELNAAGFLPKPFRNHDLVAAVDTLLCEARR